MPPLFKWKSVSATYDMQVSKPLSFSSGHLEANDAICQLIGVLVDNYSSLGKPVIAPFKASIRCLVFTYAYYLKQLLNGTENLQ